jgi:hypothetical protein
LRKYNPPGENAMRILKGIGLGFLFWIGGTIGLLVLGVVIGISRGVSGPAHATAISATVGGLKEAAFSPINLVMVALAFGLAFWLTRKSRSAT